MPGKGGYKKKNKAARSKSAGPTNQKTLEMNKAGGRSKSVEPTNQKTLEMNKAGGTSKSVEIVNQNGPKNQTKVGEEFPNRSPSPKFPGVKRNWTIFSDEELRRVKG